VSFTHGDGVWLYDTNDNQYLDALSGIAVTNLGHHHPDVTQTICSQAEKVLHTSNIYQIEPQNKLAEKLTTLTGMEQVFFSNSGAEANETAIKIARLYGHKKGIETPSIIVMEKAFHGRTMACLSASGGRVGQAGFEPLVPGFVRAPYNSIEEIYTIAQNREDIVAILVEPIQGEGGLIPPDDDYLKKLRTLCDEKGWLLMLDEIQTGIGRTGALFNYMHHGITPDVLTSAKALGNGIPIGACLMKGPACDLLQPGKHGSTFGGNPLATATALTVLEVIERDNLIANAAKQGEKLMHGLMAGLVSHPQVKSIRGRGLMIGIELDKPARPALAIGLEERVLFSITAEKVIRLLPPLIVTDEQVDEIIKRVIRVITRFYEEE
jgi:acetylornithine aminotransferase